MQGGYRFWCEEGRALAWQARLKGACQQQQGPQGMLFLSRSRARRQQTWGLFGAWQLQGRRGAAGDGQAGGGGEVAEGRRPREFGFLVVVQQPGEGGERGWVRKCGRCVRWRWLACTRRGAGRPSMHCIGRRQAGRRRAKNVGRGSRSHRRKHIRSKTGQCLGLAEECNAGAGRRGRRAP